MPISANSKPHAAFTSKVIYLYQATHETPAVLLSHTVFAAKTGIACSLLQEHRYCIKRMTSEETHFTHMFRTYKFSQRSSQKGDVPLPSPEW